MDTFLHPGVIYGPVRSRRLGLSLGVNLLPADGKICTFDCIYCECGFNAERKTSSRHPGRDEVAGALEAKLAQMAADGTPPDVITFAGNGEPTTHPHFPGIIADTTGLRDKYCPGAKVAVLTNGSAIHKERIREALMAVDDNIVKLDTVSPAYVGLVDRPVPAYDLQRAVEAMEAFRGHIIIQTMFMAGSYLGRSVDNTGEEYVAPWLETVKRIAPQSVMVYTIDRATPAGGLLKATPGQLDGICRRVRAEGIPCTASY